MHADRSENGPCLADRSENGPCLADRSENGPCLGLLFAPGLHLSR